MPEELLYVRRKLLHLLDLPNKCELLQIQHLQLRHGADLLATSGIEPMSRSLEICMAKVAQI